MRSGQVPSCKITCWAPAKRICGDGGAGTEGGKFRGAVWAWLTAFLEPLQPEDAGPFAEPLTAETIFLFRCGAPLAMRAEIHRGMQRRSPPDDIWTAMHGCQAVTSIPVQFVTPSLLLISPGAPLQALVAFQRRMLRTLCLREFRRIASPRFQFPFLRSKVACQVVFTIFGPGRNVAASSCASWRICCADVEAAGRRREPVGRVNDLAMDALQALLGLRRQALAGSPAAVELACQVGQSRGRPL